MELYYRLKTLCFSLSTACGTVFHPETIINFRDNFKMCQWMSQQGFFFCVFFLHPCIFLFPKWNNSVFLKLMQWLSGIRLPQSLGLISWQNQEPYKDTFTIKDYIRFEIHKLFSVPMLYIYFSTYVIFGHDSFINFIKLFNINSIHVELYLTTTTKKP